MIALGYDYGTTNSLIVKFDEDITSDVIKKGAKSSRMPDGQSPKRLLNDKTCDNASALDMIREFTRSMFGQVKENLPDDSDVVITLTIPNTFMDVECLQMRDAVLGACCGKDVFESRLRPENLHVLPEPVAAALYYVYLAQDVVTGPNERYLVVYDVGGGTSDFAVIGYRVNQNHEGKKDISFSVKCTTGELILGGDDFDSITEEYMRSYLMSSTGLMMTSEVRDALKRDREAVKCRVASADYSHELCAADGRNLVDGVLRLKQKAFEVYMRASQKFELFRSSAIQLRDEFRKKVEQSGRSFDVVLQSSSILPVGGSSKIPLLQKEMEQIFRCQVVDEYDFGEGARFESVSRGASIYSAWRAGLLEDIASISIEERVLHRISYMWGDRQLKTCVEKNFPSGVYSINLRPSGLQERPDGSFVIGQVHFYEGEGDVVDDSGSGHPRNAHLQTLAQRLDSLNDPIYLNGRLLNDIIVTMNLKIVDGRLHTVDFVVPEGARDRSDYYSGPISIL